MEPMQVGEYNVLWDESANFVELNGKGVSFCPALDCTYFTWNGKGVEWALEARSNECIRFFPVPITPERAALLRSSEKLPDIPADLGLSVIGGGAELRLMVCRPHLSEAGDEIGMTLTFPDTAIIHLAENKHVGRRLDADMPAEHTYGGHLFYNVLIVEMSGICLRMRVEDENLGAVHFEVRRHDGIFSLTLLWHAESSLLLGFFERYELAAEDFVRWVGEKCSARKLRDRPDVPGWLHGIDVVLYFDMMRSNWQIAHDYMDVVRAAREIKRCIEPEKVLVYLPGWQGAYDGCQPAYDPCPELGGCEQFRRMCDELHGMGYHVMLHACVYGVDPYAADAKRWEGHILSHRNGKPMAWQIGRSRPDREVLYHYRSHRLPISPARGQMRLSMSLGQAYGDVCAYITVGNMPKGAYKLRLSGGMRSITSPDCWFEAHTLYDFPYPLQFSGEMAVEIEIVDDRGCLWDGAWIQVRDATTYKSPYSTWTYPMLHGSGYDEVYVGEIVQNLSRVVKTYSIDALHLDAASFYPDGDKGTIMAIREALPKSVLLGCEYFTTWEEFAFWPLSQGACQDLVYSKFPDICMIEQESLPIFEGLPEVYAWMDKTSPVCDFTREYIRFYPHLVAANAFTPASKVSNIAPARKLPVRDGQLERVISGARRLGYITGLRLNFREYALDAKTATALRAIGRKEARR